MREIMSADVTRICGTKGKHDSDRAVYRHGAEPRLIPLGGALVGIDKPRLRVLSERVIRRATGFDLADWRRIGSGTRARMRQERLGLVAAAIGFWGTISLLPSLIVLLTIYGLISEVDDIQRQVERVLGSISEEARSTATSPRFSRRSGLRMCSL